MRLIVKHLLIILMASFFIDGYAQNPRQDSLRAVAANGQLPTASRLDALYQLAYSLRNQDPAAARQIADSVLAALPNTQVKDRARFCLVQGQALLYSGDVNSARLSIAQSLQLSQAINDTLGIGQAQHNMGNTYMYENLVVTALEHFQEAEKYYTLLRDTLRVNNLLINIGSAHFNIGDNARALEYYKRVYYFLGRAENQTGLSSVISNIGNCFYAQAQFDSALVYQRQAYQLVKHAGQSINLSTTSLNLGSIFSQIGEMDSSLAYFREAGNIAQSVGHTAIYVGAQANIADIFLRKGLYQLARDTATSVLPAARDLNDFTTLRNIYYIFYKIDSVDGNFSASLAHYKLYKAYCDSLINEETIREVANASARQGIRMQELERQIQLDEQQEAEDRRDRLQYFAAFGLICLLAFVAIVMMRIRLAPWVSQLILFVVVLLVFEFLLVLLDPTIDRLVNNAPLPKLGLNTLLALVIAPIHGWLMRWIPKRNTRSEAAQSTRPHGNAPADGADSESPS